MHENKNFCFGSFRGNRRECCLPSLSSEDSTFCGDPSTNVQNFPVFRGSGTTDKVSSK